VTSQLEAIREAIARQDEALAQASARLRSFGNAPLSVSRAALEAIDAACLVHLSPLTHNTAIRG
jgi:hypothetical protein